MAFYFSSNLRLKMFIFCSWRPYIYFNGWKSTETPLGAFYALFFLWFEADNIFSTFLVKLFASTWVSIFFLIFSSIQPQFVFNLFLFCRRLEPHCTHYKVSSEQKEKSVSDVLFDHLLTSPCTCTFRVATKFKWVKVFDHFCGLYILTILG